MYSLIALLYCASFVSCTLLNSASGRLSESVNKRSHEDDQPSSAECCRRLQYDLGDMVSFPGDAVYEEEQTGVTRFEGYWSTQAASLRPACRVTPTCTEDVACAIRTLKELSCPFAVRGGGHTSWAGAANIGADGVTIDLSALNAVRLTPDNKVAQVGGGARWVDVYLYLDEHELAVAGGRVAQVGVGGLTLGGGKSFFQARAGFACDNVESFEIVGGDGQILTASATSNADLYKALKGGSNNFGVVTQFNLYTFPQGKLWAGQHLYADTTAAAQYEALYWFTEATGMSNESVGEAQIINAYVRNNVGTFIANFLSYTEPQAWPPVFENFSKIEGELYTDARISNLTDFAYELGTGTPNNERYIFATTTFKNDLAFNGEISNASNRIFDNLFTAEIPGLMVSTVLQPLTKAMLTPGCGKNVLGLCPDDGNLMILDLTVQWTSNGDDARINAAANALIDWVTENARQRGLWSPYIYLNYALPRQNPLKSYGADNYAFLQNVSAKYDPEQVFQRLVRGGFKLNR